MMEEAFRLIDDPAGESTYLRLSTRSIRAGRAQRRRLARRRARRRLLAARARPERRSGDRRNGRGHARSARRLGRAERRRSRPRPARRHFARPAPPRLDRGAGRRAGTATRKPSHVEQLLSALPPGAGLVTIADAAPASLSWLGGVLGQRVAPLGVEKFGQTGNLADLYAAYRLDGDAITEAVAEMLSLTRRPK